MKAIKFYGLINTLLIVNNLIFLFMETSPTQQQNIQMHTTIIKSSH